MKLAMPLLIAVLLSACAGPQAPPPEFYQLRLDLPAGTTAPAPKASGDVWQLVGTIRLPEYLDRDVLWLPQGAAGLQPLPGHRWAEPLRETVPRLLLNDLGLLLGPDRIWRGTPPPGLRVTRQLRLEILDFAAAPDQRSVRLRARAAYSDPGGQTPTRVREISVEALSAGSAPGELVAAHRLALFRLAEKLLTGL